MPEDRISRLSKRFQTHAVGRQPTTQRSRERRSFYLDAELVERLDKTYRDVGHELYPSTLSKSTFLETLLEYGLEHLRELTSVLAQQSKKEDSSPNS
jgi:hypothetical protein